MPGSKQVSCDINIKTKVDSTGSVDGLNNIDKAAKGASKSLNNISTSAFDSVADGLKRNLDAIDEYIKAIDNKIKDYKRIAHNYEIFGLPDMENTYNQKIKHLEGKKALKVDEKYILRGQLNNVVNASLGSVNHNNIFNDLSSNLTKHAADVTRLVGIIEREINNYKELVKFIGNIGLENEANAISDYVNKLESELSKYKKSDDNDIFGGIDNDNDSDNGFNDIIKEASKLFSELTGSSEEASDSIGKDLVGSIGAFISKSIGMDSSLMSMCGKFGKVGIAIGAVITVFKIYINVAKTAYKVINFLKDSIDKLWEAGGNLLNKFINSLGNGVSYASNMFNSLTDAVGDFIEKMKEALDIGVDFQKGYFTLFNYLGKDGGENIVSFTKDLERLFNLDSSELVGNLGGVLAMVSNMQLSEKDKLKMIKDYTGFMHDLAAFSGDSLEEISSRLESTINFGVLDMRSPIARSLDLTDADIAAYKQLNSIEERSFFILSKGLKIRGTYNKFLGTTAGKVTQLKNQWSLLIKNISQFAMGLIDKLYPILMAILKVANALVETVAKLFGIDLTSSVGNLADNNASLADSFEDVAEESKEASRQLASFDDVIQINDKKDKGIDDKGNSEFNSGMLSGGWFDDLDREKTKLEKFLDEFKRLLSLGEFFAAGNLLNKGIRYWLSTVDFEAIKAKFKKFGTDLASFLNGLFSDPRMLGDIGRAISESINAIFEFLNSFAITFDFVTFGQGLGLAWRNFWENLDADVIASSVINYLIGGFQVIAGWLSEGGFVTFASKLSDIIISIFESLTEDDVIFIASTIIDFIDNVFESVNKLVSDIGKNEELKGKVKTFIESLVNGFSENAEEWGATLNNLATSIINGLAFVLGTAEDSGLSDAIAKFLGKLDVGDIIEKSGVITRLFDDIKIKSTIESILGSVWSWLKNWIKTELNTILETLKNTILDWASRNWRWLGPLINAFDPVIGAALSTVVGVNSYDNYKESKELLEKQQEIKQREAKIELLNPYWEDPLYRRENEKHNKNTFNIKLERLATGGIVNKSTFANIGEDGAEAVIPLENNTYWMDRMADKIASKINSARSSAGIGSTINLDLSSFSKVVYTREEMLGFAEVVVEALRVYGVNVAVTY